MRPSTLKLAGAVLLLSLLFLYQNAQGQDKGIGMVAIVEYRDGHREMCVPQEQGFWDRINPFSDVGVYTVDGVEATALYVYAYVRATPVTGQVLNMDYYYSTVGTGTGVRTVTLFRNPSYVNGAYRYMDESSNGSTNPTMGTYWEIVLDANTPEGIGDALKLKTDAVSLGTDESYVYIPLQMNESYDPYEINGVGIYPTVFDFSSGTYPFRELGNSFTITCSYTVVITDGTDTVTLSAQPSFAITR